MKAATITAPHTIEIGTVPDPTPGPADVILEVAGAGICGTDLHIFEGGYAPSLPLIPGHEFAGTVAAAGRDVQGLRVGDVVSADPNIPCWRCRYCRDGRVNLCLHYDAVGVTRAGACATYVSVPAELCVLLPETLDVRDAALLEPLSCAVHAFDLLGPRLGSSLAIYGSGTMGLMMLQLALHAGFTSIDVIDPNPAKLVAARELGASQTVARAEEADPGAGWDTVIDATGAAAAIQSGLDHVARGGTFLQFGVSTPEAVVSINPFRIYDDEIRILGAVCPMNSFERSVQLMAAGFVDASVLISDRVPLEAYADAIHAFAGGQSRKIVVEP